MPGNTDPRLDIGGNNPPPEFQFGDALRDHLAQEFGYRTVRRDELVAGAEQWLADHPTIDNDEDAGTLAGIIAQLHEEIKVVDTEREGVKAPYLSACGIVDGFFAGQIAEPLAKIKARLNDGQTEYLAAKARRIRREAEERAAKARAEAEAARLKREAEEKRKAEAEALAARKKREAEEAEAEIQRREAEGKRATKALAEKAEKAAKEAERARNVAATAETRIAAAEEKEVRADMSERRANLTANASTADRSRVRGTVAQAAIATAWTFEVLDLNKVPLVYHTINEAAVKAAIRGQHGLREIPGLRIFPDEQARNRRA
jgi:hypothetical protein